MDRLKQLEVFVAVAEAESFIGGARRLGLSAPTVTRGINQLEQRLGAKLFARTTRVVRLTEAGAQYLRDCRILLEQWRAANDSVAGVYGAPAGRLRISAPLEFGHRHIASLLPEFLASYPKIDVEALFTDRLVHMVDEGIDVALRIGSLADSSLMARRIGHVREVICASPRYVTARRLSEPCDLAELDLVVARALTPTSEWRLREHAVRVKPRLIVNSVAAAVAAVCSGWGVTRVLAYQVSRELLDGDLVVLLEDFEPPPVPVHLVYTGGRAGSARARLLVDFLAERLPQEEGLAAILCLGGGVRPTR